MTSETSSAVSLASETGNAASLIAGPLDHFISPFFVLGLIAIIAYAWQRFNEPSFPTKEALPHTLTPLRYLFFRAAYKRARYFYIGVLIFVYCILVAPGPAMAKAFTKLFGLQDFPTEAWALVVALVIAGLLPNSNVKLLTMIEESLRRLVHESFLVPDGVARAIGILEDADYAPPQVQLNAVASPLREELRKDLKRPRNSLRYRWARARMLMESLSQMGAGGEHPLQKANFDPFQEDFDEISAMYKALALDITAATEKEATLVRSVDKLLKRIYAYISWGIRYQADSQQAVDDTLEELGFRIPVTGGRRLFDIVVPPVAIVALITAIYSLAVDGISSLVGASDTTTSTSDPISESVVTALISMTATSVMYGFAVFIALKQRASQIEQKVWQQGSPRRLVPIMFRAGVTTWAVIIVTTVVLRLPEILQSLPELARVIRTLAVPAAGTATGDAPWNFLPGKIATALPWFFAGATVSVMLAYFLGGDVRLTNKAQRRRDAAVMGIGLGLAAAAATLIQAIFADKLGFEKLDFYELLSLVLSAGLANFLCGAVIGFTVPGGCRDNLMKPLDPKMARALQDLKHQAEITLGSRTAAENWVFTPHNDLLGITPAEAVQYKGLATGVRRRLDEAGRAIEQAQSDRGDRSIPVVSDGNEAPIPPRPKPPAASEASEAPCASEDIQPDRNGAAMPVLVDGNAVPIHPRPEPPAASEASEAPGVSDETHPDRNGASIPLLVDGSAVPIHPPPEPPRANA